MKFLRKLICFLKNEYSLCDVCNNKRGFWAKTELEAHVNYWNSLYTNANSEIYIKCPFCKGTGIIWR